MDGKVWGKNGVLREIRAAEKESVEHVVGQLVSANVMQACEYRSF
jgi:hypothetical protein